MKHKTAGTPSTILHTVLYMGDDTQKFSLVKGERRQCVSNLASFISELRNFYQHQEEVQVFQGK